MKIVHPWSTMNVYLVFYLLSLPVCLTYSNACGRYTMEGKLFGLLHISCLIGVLVYRAYQMWLYFLEYYITYAVGGFESITSERMSRYLNCWVILMFLYFSLTKNFSRLFTHQSCPWEVAIEHDECSLWFQGLCHNLWSYQILEDGVITGWLILS